MGFFDRNKTADELREELIDDTFAMAICANIPEAIMEVPDIEAMSDDEVIKEAKRRGLV